MTGTLDPTTFTSQPRARAGELASHAFLEQLQAEALNHPALSHPWIGAMETSAFPDMRVACREFARVYNAYSAWFPSYLQAVIDNLSDPDARDLLAENLAEEKGDLHQEDREALEEIGIPIESVLGVPHPQLFRRFCTAVDLTEADLREVPAVSASWREKFRGFLSTATEAEGVGALGLGTESVVGPLYDRLLKGIECTEGLTRPDWVFFELHCKVDDQHQKDLLEIAAKLATTHEGRAGLRRGMLRALDLRLAVWDELWDRCQGRRGEVA